MGGGAVRPVSHPGAPDLRRSAEVCRPLLGRVCPGEPEEGWLSYCGQYIKNIMFPEGGFAPARPEFGGGAILYLTVLQLLLDQERAALPFDPMLDFCFLT